VVTPGGGNAIGRCVPVTWIGLGWWKLPVLVVVWLVSSAPIAAKFGIAFDLGRLQQVSVINDQYQSATVSARRLYEVLLAPQTIAAQAAFAMTTK